MLVTALRNLTLSEELREDVRVVTFTLDWKGGKSILLLKPILPRWLE